MSKSEKNNIRISHKEKSLTKNSIYYVLYNVLNILFPVITGIYVARVLLPNDIGEIGYAQNIAQYFVILSFLGIPTYGMREIAKVRDDYAERSRLFSELFVINFLSTIVFLTIYGTLILSVAQFRDRITIYLITGSAIALNFLNISWLYEGLEEFQFISIRNIAFKIINFILLVLFVRNENDYIIYAVITVVGTAGNYILNILYSPRFVKYSLKELNLKRHMKSIFMLVVVNLAIEIYSLVDVTMLGNMTTKENVAYYSYGQRIQRILLQIINSFTMVIVPRISNYYKHHKIEEFNALISRTLEIIIVLSVPMIIGIMFTGRDIVTLLYGNQYFRAAEVLQILSLLLFISPIGYLLGSRVLLVSGQERKMVFCVGLGAVVNIFCNFFLIQLFQEKGAAIASVISEIVVMAVYVTLGRKEYKLTDNKQNYKKISISVALLCFYLITTSFLQIIVFAKLLVEILGSVIVYFGTLVLLKETTVYSYYNVFYSKIIKRGGK